MGTWSKLALIAAGALAGSVATRAAARTPQRDPARPPAGPLQRRRPDGAPDALLQRRLPGALAQRRTAALERVRVLAGRLGRFAARVKAGMDERETELREQFGVRAPVDHTADHPAASRPGAETHAVVEPGGPGAEISTHVRSEGNHR